MSGDRGSQGFWSRYVFSLDHRVIGLQYLFTSMVMALAGGLLALLVRVQIAWPDHDYSLNHALTRISELLEVRRISHTGNVFSRYLVSPPGSRDGRLVRLGVLRDGY